MTYYDVVTRDTPLSLYMLDGDVVDATGRGANGTLTGGWQDAAPMVDGPTRSFRSEASINFLTVPFTLGSAGKEKEPFSIEVWQFVRNNVTFRILDSAAANLGFTTTAATGIAFTLPLSTGNIVLRYKPFFFGTRHLVATYDTNTVKLFVDGELRAEHTLTDAQKSASFVGTNTSLGHNTGTQIGPIAIYNYALSQQSIKAHWNSGNRNAGSLIASNLHSGKYIEISTKTSNLFSQKVWNAENWTLGYTNAKRASTISSATDDTGAYLDSYWMDTLELESGGQAVDAVQLEWDGSGTFVVETSIDGLFWQAVTNGKQVPQIVENFSTNNRVLRIRVRFTAGNFGEVTSLRAIGFKDRTVMGRTSIPVDRPINSTVYTPREMNLFDERTGIEFNGTLTIGPNSEIGALPVKSVGAWYYIPSGSWSLGGFTIGTFYENNVVRTARVITNQWVYVVATHPTGSTNAITFTGTGLKLAYVSLWEEELTAAQIAQIYKSFTGFPTIKSTNVDSMGVITDQDASVYANDWSITKAGV